MSGVLTALFGCSMAGAMWNCCHFSMFCVHCATTHHVVSLHTKPHMLGACVFSWNLPLALLAKWLGSFTCYCSNMGVNGYWNKSQHRKLTQEKRILPLLMLGLEPVTVWSWIQCSNHWAVPAPQRWILQCFISSSEGLSGAHFEPLLAVIREACSLPPHNLSPKGFEFSLLMTNI